MQNKQVNKEMTKRRAKRLNMPEMVELFEDMAITETDTHWEISHEDWQSLSAMWGGHKPEIISCSNCEGLR